MSGRQQRVMVQPIVCNILSRYTLILISRHWVECYFQKPSAGACTVAHGIITRIIMV